MRSEDLNATHIGRVSQPTAAAVVTPTAPRRPQRIEIVICSPLWAAGDKGSRVIHHLGWPYAIQPAIARFESGHKITSFDRRGITKKNPASEATRAGLSPVIRDPYASRYRSPAEQIGRSPRAPKSGGE